MTDSPKLPEAPSAASTLDVVNRLAELARELGSDRVQEEATALAERLSEGRFYVACVGQFKRGKSTLLDALIGERILPTGVLPVTAVPTVVRWGARLAARIRFRGGSWSDVHPAQISEFVSEDKNPENKKGVAAVEVFVPSQLLADGMCLVDTPGIGSVFTGNTAATRAFVPHVDAALVVVGADPPISAEELALVEDVAKHAREIIVVLSKADKSTTSERTAAKSFTARVFESRLHRPIGAICEISAEEVLDRRGAARDWPALVSSLQDLSRQSGHLVRGAAERGICRLSEELLFIAAQEKDALTRPIHESERLIHDLRQTISGAEQSLRDLGYLFTAEQHRLSGKLISRREAFLSAAMPGAAAEFDAAIRRIPGRFGPSFRRAAMRAVLDISERKIRPWLESEQVFAEDEYRNAAIRFVNIGNDFLTQLSEAGVSYLSRTPNSLDAEKGFRVPSRFSFERFLRVSLPASPLRYLADVFLGIAGASSVIARDAQSFLAHSMETNTARVQSDVLDRLQESRGLLEAEIRKILAEVTRIAERAVERARAAQAEGAAGVAQNVAHLDSIDRAIRGFRSQIAPPSTDS